MKALIKKLKQLEKDGYEYVTIQQVLSWIHMIQGEARIKRHKLDQ